MDRIDMRIADARTLRRARRHARRSGRCALWVHLPGLVDLSPATLSIVGDYVPFGISQALGQRAGGNSLDNTLRVASRAPDRVDPRRHPRARDRPRLRSRPRAPLDRGRHACSAPPASPPSCATGARARPNMDPRTDRRRRSTRMTVTQRWGITDPARRRPAEEHQRVVRGAGATSASPTCGRAETNAHDAFTPLTLAAVWAPSLRLGQADRARLHARSGAPRAVDRDPRRHRARARRRSASARRAT